jgi:hypothetical protein
MSSYLERFATNARTPSTRIAPLVRPLYLPARSDPEPPGSSLARPEPESVAPSPLTVNRTPREAREARPHTPAALTSPPPPAEPEFEPLIPERPPSHVAAPPPVAPAETPALRPAAGEPPEPLPITGSRPDTADLRPGRIRRQPADSRSSLVPLTRSAPAPPQALRTNQAERRAADEIQIHIGRVEIVALAPPPSQPAPPQRERRTLRLEDYLRSAGETA